MIHTWYISRLSLLLFVSSHWAPPPARCIIPLLNPASPNNNPSFHFSITLSLSVLLMAMAENLDDGEFYLPPQFLDDDVFPSDFPLDFPSDFPLDFVSSDFSSPVESSEAESSEEDERFTDFTHRLPFSSLQLHSPQKPKVLTLTLSLFSTLLAFFTVLRYSDLLILFS